MSVQGTMFNPYMNYYNSYAAMGDLYGFEDYNYAPMGSPMAFNGNMGFGGYNYQQYYDNMTQMQDFYTQYSVHNAELQRRADITINSPDEGIHRTLQVLSEKIASSEQEQIMGALADFRDAIRQKYPYATDEQIRNYVSAEYSRRTNSSLTGDIMKYGSSSFMQGFKQGIGLGLFADNKTAAENVAEITGQPESRSSEMAKHTGRATGVAALGAAIGTCIAPGLGTLIGAGVGFIGGFIVSKVHS